MTVANCVLVAFSCPMQLVSVLPSQLPWRRHLSVHEHYSLDIMAGYGLSVPKGEVAVTPEQAKQIADKLGEYSQNTALALG